MPVRMSHNPLEMVVMRGRQGVSKDVHTFPVIYDIMYALEWAGYPVERAGSPYKTGHSAMPSIKVDITLGDGRMLELDLHDISGYRKTFEGDTMGFCHFLMREFKKSLTTFGTFIGN